MTTVLAVILVLELVSLVILVHADHRARSAA
jgi:hypothetical protein